MAPLIALSTSENPNCMCLAVSALRRLLELEANRLELVRLRGLGPLAAGGLSYDKETKREVAAALNNLTLTDEIKEVHFQFKYCLTFVHNRHPQTRPAFSHMYVSTHTRTHQVVARSAALETLIKLGQSDDLETARNATGSVANLAEDVGTHDHIAKNGGGKFLIGLMHHDSIDIHREASRAIANFLTRFESHETIIKDGAWGRGGVGRRVSAWERGLRRRGCMWW